MLWTQSDIDLLKTYKTEGKSDKDIAIIMNRSIHSIHAKSMRLGFCEFTHFTNKQKDELKILYTKMTYVELSKYFNKIANCSKFIYPSFSFVLLICQIYYFFQL